MTKKELPKGIYFERGSMQFIFDGEYIGKHRFISKENETPSQFIMMVLKNTKNISGIGTSHFLETELKEFIDESRPSKLKSDRNNEDQIADDKEIEITLTEEKKKKGKHD